MVIREAGLLFRGYSLVNATYHTTSHEEIDTDLRSGLLTALLSFAEGVFKTGGVEYFELKKFIIAFVPDEIVSADTGSESLLCYAILDKEKKVDKYINKIIIPSLQEIIKEFKSRHGGKNLSEVSQFQKFGLVIEKIFGDDRKTVDQKFKGIFS